MKQTILSLLALITVCSSATFAFDKDPTTKNFTKKLIAVPQKFSSLVLYDVDIVLTKSDNTGVRIEGERKGVDAVSLLTNANELTVMNSRSSNRKDKVKVYIPASLLNKIKLYGTSRISSEETLSNPALDVYVDCRCKVNLKSYGTVNVETDEKCDYASSVKTTAVN